MNLIKMKRFGYLRILRVPRLMGYRWVARRLLYEMKRRLGILEQKYPIQRWETVPAPEVTGNFLSRWVPSQEAIARAEGIQKGQFVWFFHHAFQVGFPPDWFHNPFEKESTNRSGLSRKHWSRISDFRYGDIKCIWELSRFAWAYPLIQGYQASKDESYCEAFWKLLMDWADRNPPHRGVHWKCGQEIAVRMFALVEAYFVFHRSPCSQHEWRKMLRRILFFSASRIESNIGYALNQKNNHGISEASGLFTAGVLFRKRCWIEKARQYLESQAHELIYEDGSFSQHSINYHRVMLHAFLWAICIGRANGIPFSAQLMDRIRLAGKWLMAFHDPESGRMPNLGSNDGALVLPVSGSDYRDYRPTIQAVGVVLDGNPWLPQGKWDDLGASLATEFLATSGEPAKHRPAAQESNNGKDKASLIFSKGGYAVLRAGRARLIFRCPTAFRHRPSHCDLLHVDLWVGGANFLRDGGSFSYNSPWQGYFRSAVAHNTIQFDEHDQMPEISRFLLGHWPRPQVRADVATNSVQASFTDWKGCFHQRAVTLNGHECVVRDSISGFRKKAVLRWRLDAEHDWRQTDDGCLTDGIRIQVEATGGAISPRIEKGWESLYYQERTSLPVLEVLLTPACSGVMTTIAFKD